MLLRRHRYFYQQAALMLLHAEAGEVALAEQTFKACQHASRQIVLLLKELQRGLPRGRGAAQPRTGRQERHARPADTAASADVGSRTFGSDSQFLAFL